MQTTDDDKLVDLFIPVLTARGVDIDKFSREYIAKAISLVKSRINFVEDLWDQAGFFFVAPTEYDPKAVKKRWNEQMPEILEYICGILASCDDFSCTSVEPKVLNYIKENELHMGNVMNAFRLTVVGECKGPHMFEITELMGVDETISRIRTGVKNISAGNESAL